MTPKRRGSTLKRPYPTACRKHRACYFLKNMARTVMERAQSVRRIHAALFRGECKIGTTITNSGITTTVQGRRLSSPVNCVSEYTGDA